MVPEAWYWRPPPAYRPRPASRYVDSVGEQRCLADGWRPKKGGEPHGMVWMRAAGKLPDNPHVHVAVLVYATDFTLTETVMRPHGIHWLDKGVMTASLDHCVWIHREVKADEWWLYVQDSPSAGGARGLARGSIFDRKGQLVASVAQEVLLRTPPAQ